ncbi:MAG: ferritin [Saprospiraceae bacterium]|nr:ferritin [Saprospiraceae bacterium]
MISDKMKNALNEQIQLEGQASSLYLSMSVWCDQKGLEGCAQFLRRQSEEEREHMLRIFDYMSEVDVMALTPGIQEPEHDFPSIQELFKRVYAHEQKVSNSIYRLLQIALEENDYTTQHFLQWYVAEQKEEENLMRSILDKINLIGEGPMTLYYIDKEVAAINLLEEAAEEEVE